VILRSYLANFKAFFFAWLKIKTFTNWDNKLKTKQEKCERAAF